MSFECSRACVKQIRFLYMEDPSHWKYMPKDSVPEPLQAPSSEPRAEEEPALQAEESWAYDQSAWESPANPFSLNERPKRRKRGSRLRSKEDFSKRGFWLVLSAQVISLIFSPFYLPLVAFVALFIFSYLHMLPPITKLLLIVIVYFFTVLLPRWTIFLYRKLNGWTRHQLSKRERRYIPYVMSIISYSTLLYLLYSFHMPRFTLGIIAGALIIQVFCALVNSLIKVSTHAAASGGVIGALMAFSIIFNFNPISWLCLTILLSGLVCTARLILREHTLSELGWGVVIGIFSGLGSILLI